MNIQKEFWKDSLGWPNDNASFVFLGRAVHAIGKSMYGSEWTGEEPFVEFLQSLPTIPVTSGGSAHFANDLLVKHHPEFDRQATKWQPKRPGIPGGGIPPTLNFTVEEWEAARAIVAADHQQKSPAINRFSKVCDRIIQLAEAELLITAMRETRGGDPELIPRRWWRSESSRLRRRFDFCQIDPEDPYGIFSAGGHHKWLFVTRESLESCCVASAPSASFVTAPKKVVAAEDQSAKPRRIPESQIEPAFRKWRESQDDIPIEEDDIAYMRSLGVSREKVRELRRKYGSRGRGQHKKRGGK